MTNYGFTAPILAGGANEMLSFINERVLDWGAK